MTSYQSHRQFLQQKPPDTSTYIPTPFLKFSVEAHYKEM
ncbi:hypothetical protein PJE062_1748 [Pseudovibrio sp. JE062]|nr:hypothetical protein PJE062_1748 [Pseudovibrio sp. JE062]